MNLSAADLSYADATSTIGDVLGVWHGKVKGRTTSGSIESPSASETLVIPNTLDEKLAAGNSVQDVLDVAFVRKRETFRLANWFASDHAGKDGFWVFRSISSLPLMYASVKENGVYHLLSEPDRTVCGLHVLQITFDKPAPVVVYVREFIRGEIVRQIKARREPRTNERDRARELGRRLDAAYEREEQSLRRQDKRCLSQNMSRIR